MVVQKRTYSLYICRKLLLKQQTFALFFNGGEYILIDTNTTVMTFSLCYLHL